MLERVCSNAEPAAYAVLRSIEKPFRSTRLLHPHFFRNEGECLDNPQWWPLYLESIRQVPQNIQKSFDTVSITPAWQKPCPRRKGCFIPRNTTSRDKIHRFRAPTTDPIRTFIASVRRQQQSVLNPVETDNVEDVDHLIPPAKVQEVEVDEQIPAVEETWSSTYASSRSSSVDRFKSIIQVSAPSNEQFYRAWKSFIVLEDQAEYAVDMFLFLSKSTVQRDLRRSIQAFRLIPKKYQGQNLYQIAVDVELRLYQHREAIYLAVDGALRGFDLLPQLLAHFVRNLLWAAAAELWQRNESGRRDAARFTLAEDESISETIIERKVLLSKCASMIDLPTKTVALAERLTQNDPVYMEQKPVLKTLCARLAVTVVDSEQIMRSITAKGLLTVLDLQNQIDINSLHKIALNTLFELSISSAKDQLALLVFRNWRFRQPDEKVPRLAFGSLISICGRARCVPDIFDFIMEEFTKSHGKPDRLAYQKVITICARQGQVDAVHKYFAACAKDYGSSMSIEYMTPLIYVYASHGDSNNARKQFDWIQNQFSIKHNTHSWNMLILAHARSEDKFAAFDIFDEMIANDVAPNEYTFGTLISLCALHGDVDSTLEWVQRARDAGVDITSPMIGSVVEAHLYSDEIAEAEEVVEAATATYSSESLTRLWNSLLRYYSFKRDTEGISRVQNRMKTLHVKPDGMTFAALMAALVGLRRTTDAAQILRTLHINQNLDANAFHYCILLQGYVLENNRNMATVVYHEMQGRFPRVTARAQRSMLKLQSNRGGDADDPFKTRKAYLDFSYQHAIEFLAQIIPNISTTDYVPGAPDFKRRGPAARNDLVAQYFDTLLVSMIRAGSIKQAERLVSEFDGLLQSSLPGMKQISEPSLKILNIQMELAIQRQNWAKVDELWNKMFSNATKKGQSVPKARLAQSDSLKDAYEDGKVSKFENSEMFATDITQFSSMVPTLEQESLHASPVLRAYRFMLSRSLSTYLHALDLQLRHDDIVQLLEGRFVRSGFELDGKNWNTYIQVLTKSPNPEHRIKAFRLFEEKMLPLTPQWKLLRRGKMLENDVSDPAISQPENLRRNETGWVAIKDKQKVNPSLPIPTYYTMVYLATALTKAYLSAEQGDRRELVRLEKSAVRTLRRVQGIPYLKDRVQGLLLRGREISGDFERRPRSEASIQQNTDTSGVLGSKSPIDNVPLEHLDEIEKVIAPHEDIRSLLKGTESNLSSSIDTDDLRFADKVIGEINLSRVVLASKNRHERKREKSLRIRDVNRQRLSVIQAIRKDSKARHLVSDQYRGDPAPKLTNHDFGVDRLSSDSSAAEKVQWPLEKIPDLRIKNTTRHTPSYRATTQTPLSTRSARDTTVLNQFIPLPRQRKYRVFVKYVYRSPKTRREFTKQKFVSDVTKRAQVLKSKKLAQKLSQKRFNAAMRAQGLSDQELSTEINANLPKSVKRARRVKLEERAHGLSQQRSDPIGRDEYAENVKKNTVSTASFIPF